MQYNVAIIGGGASGLVAAIAARRSGASVVILERNPKLGRKILATGNGRCNLGNEDLSLSHFVSQDLKAAAKILQRFSGEAALEFFRQLGLEFTYEDGRIYPRSKQAASVEEVLQHELKRLDVHIELDSAVTAISPAEAGFKVIYGQGKAVVARTLVLATGGKAGPQLGCSGDGYTWVRRLGHTVIEPMPALVGLKLDSPYLKTLSGLRLEARVEIPELNLAETGEVIFTDYGLSGIPVFDLTRLVGHKTGLTLEIRLTPEMASLNQLIEQLEQRFSILAHKQVDEALVGMLPRQLISPVLKEADLHPTQAARKANKAGVTRLANTLWSFGFPIIGLNTWEQAQTTFGGVPLTEVDAATLESKLAKGLFLAGELLDVHGRCGGYNLHWAWASGFIAGKSAGSRVKAK